MLVAGMSLSVPVQGLCLRTLTIAPIARVNASFMSSQRVVIFGRPAYIQRC